MDWPLRDGLVVGLAGAAISWVAVRLTRRVALSRGWTAPVRDDRWHSEATPLHGGVAIAVAFAAAIAVGRGAFDGFRDATSAELGATLALVGGAFMCALVGFADDLFHFKPATKLAAQIACACAFLWATGGIAVTGLAVLDTTIEVVWIVGMMNALNMLDNMDGVAATAAAIGLAALSLALGLMGDGVNATLACAAAGAVAGFLVHNLPRARIFMGDAGSLMLGFVIAAFVLLAGRQGVRPSVSVVVAGVGAAFVPLVDLVVVSVTRVRRGQSPMQGGRDHTTHRLSRRGWSGWAIVFAVAAASVAAGLLAVAAFAGWIAMEVAAVILALTFVGVAATLMRMAISMDNADQRSPAGRLQRREAWEPFAKVAGDMILVGAALGAGYLLRWEGEIPVELANALGWSMPVTVACCLAVNSSTGAYWRHWRNEGLRGALRAAAAALGGSVLSVAVVAALWAPERLFSRAAMALFVLLYPTLVFGVRWTIVLLCRTRG